MVWSQAQMYRLAIEKEKLERLFYVTWIDPTGETKVEVEMISNSGNSYVLRICLPSDFPNSCPRLQLVSPTPLYLRDGSVIPVLSGRFHTLEKFDGFISICHFYPPDWTNDNTLYQIFMKGRIWLEAYEAHLETGMDMDAYLGEMEFTPDPNNPWVVHDENAPLSNNQNPTTVAQRGANPPGGRNVPLYSDPVETNSAINPVPVPARTSSRRYPPEGGVDIMAAFRGGVMPTLRPRTRPPATPKPSRQAP